MIEGLNGEDCGPGSLRDVVVDGWWLKAAFTAASTVNFRVGEFPHCSILGLVVDTARSYKNSWCIKRVSGKLEKALATDGTIFLL